MHATTTPSASSTLATKKSTSAPRRASAVCGTEAPPARAADLGTAPAPTFGRRRGDLERVLAARDPGAHSLARYAFAESQRRGLIDARLLFEEWVLDAVNERAAAVALSLLGLGDHARAAVDSDGEGLVRSYYFTGEGV